MKHAAAQTRMFTIATQRLQVGNDQILQSVSASSCWPFAYRRQEAAGKLGAISCEIWSKLQIANRDCPWDEVHAMNSH